jgi:hypothetical protein
VTHYHIKSSTGNALRDEEIHCVDGRDFATLALTQDLYKLTEWLFDGCDRGHCGYCGWCQAAKKAKVEAQDVTSTRVETDLMGASGIVIDNPASQTGAFLLWMESVPGQRGTCNDH